ncbi:MAG: TniQ family protein, partial [Pseudomonadota bacterium]|nr:TniQ family protein [Pseudomonadota bacterium]
MFDLLVNPAPKHDESLSGYLHRLGDCNGLWNGEVIKLFKDLTDEQASKWLDEDIRPVSWKDVALEIRAPQFNIQNVWSLINIKYCPVCLAGGFYWRELWDLTLYTTCIFHNVNLVY